MAQKPHKGIGLVVMIGKDGGPAGPMMTPEQRRQHAADVEADFTGRPQPHGTYDPQAEAGRASAEAAGYMELDGAAKDGDCELVDVPGGVSGQKGCCNLFGPQPGADGFRCGECVHFSASPTPGAAGAGQGGEDQDHEEAVNG